MRSGRLTKRIPRDDDTLPASSPFPHRPDDIVAGELQTGDLVFFTRDCMM
jgi:hypothetical protein